MKFRSETQFSADVQAALRREALLDVVQTETSIDDGLPDWLITDIETGRSSWIELKVGELKSDTLHFSTLQSSQINFLSDRSKHVTQNAFILIEHVQGMFLIKAEPSIAWRRLIVTKKCFLSSSIGKPVEWSGLAAALWPPLG